MNNGEEKKKGTYHKSIEGVNQCERKSAEKVGEIL